MIRQPTPILETLRWHSAALRGPVDRHDGEPQAGWYKRRAVKDGPWIPVRIWLHQETDPETGELTADEKLRASELGRAVDPVPIWTYLRPIPREEYDALVRLHVNLDAMAATHAPIDLTTTPIKPQRNLL